MTDVKQPSILDALSKPKPASKSTKKAAPTSSSDSESKLSSKAAPPTQKAAANRKRKPVLDSDSESGSDDLMARIKGKMGGGKVALQ